MTSAAEISFTPAAGLASTDVQAALEELAARGTGIGPGYGDAETVPTLGGFFADDEPATQVHRFRDRVFFGAAAPHTGNRVAANGLGGTWLTEHGANYFEKNAQVVVLSDQRMALLVGAYTPPGVAANMNIGLGAVTLHRGTNSNGRAIYAEAMHAATGTGNTDGIEIQVGNYGSIDPAHPTAYSAAGPGVTGLAIGAESGNGYVTGDTDTPIATPLYPAVTAIRIGGGSLGAGYQRFRTGLMFMENSLFRGATGTSGKATAISLAQNYEIEWRASHTLKGGLLRSDVTAVVGADVGVIFANSQVKLTGASEALIARFDHNANAVNGFVMSNSAAGNPIIITCTGSDTNITMSYRVKGVGEHQFFSHAGTVTAFRIRSVVSAVNALSPLNAVTGAPPQLTVLGSDTNIDLQLTPKGSGLVRFGAWTTNADAAVNGYVTIKDAAGNTRKLATIA